MSVVAFAKNQMRVGRCIGRKDFRGAIRILESSLSNNSSDVPSLQMIALCHRWSQRNDLAIATAQQVLAYDSENFGAIWLLSEVYADQNEHDAAAKFARLGMENYPKHSPGTPKWVFWFLRLGAAIFPSFKRIEESAKRDLTDPDKDTREWYSWAKEYLTWYDASFGNKQTPTVH